MQSDCIYAVRLHRMSDDVKGLRQVKVAETETGSPPVKPGVPVKSKVIVLALAG